jgi:hypothetical protein
MRQQKRIWQFQKDPGRRFGGFIENVEAASVVLMRLWKWLQQFQ